MMTMMQHRVQPLPDLRWATWLGRKLDKPLPVGVEIKFAETEQEFEGAFRLLYDTYFAQGYIPPNPWGLHLNLFLLLPRTRTFIAKNGDRVVAVLSMVRDSPLGLPIDDLFRAEMNQLRPVSALRRDKMVQNPSFRLDSDGIGELHEFLQIRGSNLAELTGFAVAHDYQSTTVVLQLMKWAYQYSLVIGLESYVIEVIPEHAVFYEHYWGFDQLADGKVFPTDLAPAVALAANVAGYTRRCERIAPHVGGIDRMLQLKGRELLAFMGSVSAPMLTPAAVQKFLTQKSDLWASVSAPERTAFELAYVPFRYDFAWAHSDGLEQVPPQSVPALRMLVQ